MKKIVVYQEEISDCGVACLLSIIRHYNGDANLEALRIDSNTTNKGVSAYDLIECAKKYGFNASGYKDNDYSKYNLPCILHINISQSLSHFVVLYEIKEKTLLIMDPAKGLKKVDKELIQKQFTGNIIILEPINNLPKKTNLNIIKEELSYQLKIHHKNLTKIIILEILFIILSIVNSFYIKIYNHEKYLIILSIVFLIAAIVIEFISYLVYKCILNLRNSINSNLSNYFYNHILKLPLKYLHLKDPGEIVKRANEINLINEIVIDSAISITISILILLSTIPFLFTLSKMTLIIISISIILISALSAFIMSNLKRRSKDAIESATDHNNYLIDGIYSLTSLKHSRANEFLKNRMESSLENKHKCEKSYNLYLKKYETIKSSLLSVTRLVLNIYLISKIYTNSFSFEKLIIINAFIEIILNAASNIISSVMELNFVKNLFMKANDFYNIKDTQISSNKKFINGDITIKNINYTYNSNYPIIKNFTTTIKKGEKVIIKGESGTGKSTLCKILYREVDSYIGEIAIADNNIMKINLEDYRKHITYSSQTERILNGTIKENILLGKKINEEFLNKIIELCEIERITKKRVFGIETLLFSGGEELSGGERQLIILARALVDNFDILILDETLSEVNDEVEDKILKNLFEHFKDKTIIYVSHKNNKNYFERTINV